VEPQEKFILVVFGDGSIQGHCILEYVRWDLKNGTASCRRLFGKTRLTPKKLSVLRMELIGALLAVRPGKKRNKGLPEDRILVYILL
jgi:hypothetical protein